MGVGITSRERESKRSSSSIPRRSRRRNGIKVYLFEISFVFSRNICAFNGIIKLYLKGIPTICPPQSQASIVVGCKSDVVDQKKQRKEALPAILGWMAFNCKRKHFPSKFHKVRQQHSLDWFSFRISRGRLVGIGRPLQPHAHLMVFLFGESGPFVSASVSSPFYFFFLQQDNENVSFNVF